MEGTEVGGDLQPVEVRAPRLRTVLDGRVVFLGALATALGLAMGLLAEGLLRLIGLVTNLAYFHRLSTQFTSPAGHHLGAWALLVPVAGGLIVGLMARYGSAAIRGHGIPEAMEQILLNDSRIPPRLTFLKPLSAAIAIGTGGPFGAEGPIIATGGALGSVVGQFIPMSGLERKTLLAAGAAAGMAATFGSPVSAVVLAVELLLFEYHPRSIIPVVLASVTAAALRGSLVGFAPVFPMPVLARPTGSALALYIGVGAAMGLVSVLVTKAVYLLEDGFDRLPLHWMWWPALGGLAVGLVGLWVPRTLGVGYDNIQGILSSELLGPALLALFLAKFLSWAIALGSGTSGGTLAPLFTLGGALGALLGGALAALLPRAGVDPRVCALVGMAAIFAGASRTLLASAIFVFEVTLQPLGLLPLLGGCAAAYLVSARLMRQSIMTEKLARRGIRVPEEYTSDYLDQLLVKDFASREVTVLEAGMTLGDARIWLETDARAVPHHGFPVVDAQGRALGVLTRRDILEPAHPPAARLRDLLRRDLAVALEGNSLREAADHMIREGVGRLLILDGEGRVAGILTRSDLLEAHAGRLRHAERASGPAPASAPEPGWTG